MVAQPEVTISCGGMISGLSATWRFFKFDRVPKIRLSNFVF